MGLCGPSLLLTVAVVWTASVVRADLAPVLADWMGELLPVLNDVSLMDIPLVGCHDCLTSDSSEVVAENYDDIPPFVEELLHWTSEWIPYFNQVLRGLSMTQRLSLPQLLDSGVRFIDFRITWTSNDFYGVHFVQTHETALYHLQSVRDWLEKHPSEIVIFFISMHGAPCNSHQYPPKVSQENMNHFWKEVEDLYHGIAIPNNIQINQTSVKELIRRNHRVLFLVAEYKEFTAKSQIARDSCLQFTEPVSHGIENIKVALEEDIKAIRSAAAANKNAKRIGRFHVRNFASSMNPHSIEQSLKCNTFGIQCNLCAGTYNLSHSSFCPSSLLQVGQLNNFYRARAIETAFLENVLEFPNIVEFDAIDADGTIRVGPDTNRYGSGHRFSLVDSILPTILDRHCSTEQFFQKCAAIRAAIVGRRHSYPYHSWTDLKHGRIANWPKL